MERRRTFALDGREFLRPAGSRQMRQDHLERLQAYVLERSRMSDSRPSSGDSVGLTSRSATLMRSQTGRDRESANDRLRLRERNRPPSRGSLNDQLPSLGRHRSVIQQAGAQSFGSGGSLSSNARVSHADSRERGVMIPGIGWMNRGQLVKLHGVLFGDLDPSDVSDLPDLTGLSAEQMELLEDALHGMHFGMTNDLVQDQIDGEDDDVQVPRLERTAYTQARRLDNEYSSTRGDLRGVSFQSSHAADPLLVMMSSSDARGNASEEVDSSRKAAWRFKESTTKQLMNAGKAGSSEEECAICYLPMEDGVAALPCSKNGCLSFFHLDCVRPWLEKNPTCPLCRGDCKELVEKVEQETESLASLFYMDDGGGWNGTLLLGAVDSELPQFLHQAPPRSSMSVREARTLGSTGQESLQALRPRGLIQAAASAAGARERGGSASSAGFVASAELLLPMSAALMVPRSILRPQMSVPELQRPRAAAAAAAVARQQPPRREASSAALLERRS